MGPDPEPEAIKCMSSVNKYRIVPTIHGVLDDNGKIWSAPQGVDSVEKLDWLDPLLPYKGAYTEGIGMVWYNEKKSKVSRPSLLGAYEGSKPIL